MDTDDLSTEAYQAIIIEAERFNEDLTLHFGLLASDCKDEDEYFTKVSEMISEIRTLDKEELADIFFGNLPNIKSLYLTLDRIIINIKHVNKIPKERRHYEF